jgi:predicted TIM-barrel fold metal-dependent hydrolase
VIDVHVHLEPPCLPGAGSLGPVLGLPVEQRAALFREAMAAAGVTAALAMGRLNGTDALGVAETLAVARHVPGLYAIGAMDPRRGEEAGYLAAVEEQLKRGDVKALKGYLGYLHFGPDHPGYRPYYALAERFKLPVVFHTGDTYSPRAKLRYAHPLLVDDVAVDFPGVNFVIAHVGNPWLIDAAEVVYKNFNVWADLSGLAVDGAYDDETLEAVGRAFRYAARPNRFLFGTDWPLAPLGEYAEWIAAAIPEEHHDAVFTDNARRLFRLEVGDGRRA